MEFFYTNTIREYMRFRSRYASYLVLKNMYVNGLKRKYSKAEMGH